MSSLSQKKKIGIITFAFGRPSSLPSNVLLSQYTQMYAKQHSAPTFTQYDIKIQTGEVTTTAGAVPTTRIIAKRAAKWVRKNNFETIYIVAARPHLRRCIRDIKKECRSINVSPKIIVIPEIYRTPNTTWFHKQSIQWHTRNAFLWWLRETCLLSLPYTLYKRIV